MDSHTYKNLYLNLKMNHVLIPDAIPDAIPYIGDMPETSLELCIAIDAINTRIRRQRNTYIPQLSTLPATTNAFMNVINRDNDITNHDAGKQFIVEMITNNDRLNEVIANLDSIISMHENISTLRMIAIDKFKDGKNAAARKYIDAFVDFYITNPARDPDNSRSLEDHWESQVGHYENMTFENFKLLLKDDTFYSNRGNFVHLLITNSIILDIVNSKTSSYYKTDAIRDCWTILRDIRTNRDSILTSYDVIQNESLYDELRSLYIRSVNINNTAIQSLNTPIMVVNDATISEFDSRPSLVYPSNIVQRLMNYYLTGEDMDVANYVGNFVRNTDPNQKIIIIDFANVVGQFNDHYRIHPVGDRNRDFVLRFANYFIQNCLINNSIIFCVFKPFEFTTKTFPCELFKTLHNLGREITYFEFNSKFVCYGSHMISIGDDRISCTYDRIRRRPITSGHDDFLFWLLTVIFSKAIVMTAGTDLMAKQLLETKLVLMTHDAQVVNRNNNDNRVQTKELITDCISSDETCGALPVLITVYEKFRNKSHRRYVNVEAGMDEESQKKHRHDNTYRSYETKYELDPMQYGPRTTEQCVQYYIDNDNFNTNVLAFYNSIKVGSARARLVHMNLASRAVIDYRQNRDLIFVGTPPTLIGVGDIVTLFNTTVDAHYEDLIFYKQYLTIQQVHFGNFERAHGLGWAVTIIT